MKTINILLSAVFGILLTAGSAAAQSANSFAIGLRACPDGAGLTAKYLPDKNVAIELQLNGSGGFNYAIGNSGNYGPSFAAVGLLEYNIIFPDPSWRIFIGPGMHFGSWDRYHYNPGENYRGTQAIFGVDGIVGVEYIFTTVPIGISVDVKPAMNFAAETAYFPNNMFGISGRYYFGQKMMHHKERSVR